MMLYQHFAQAWERFSKAEGDEQEKMATEHPLYATCRDIYYEQQSDRLKKARERKS